MRCLMILLLCCLLGRTICRPQAGTQENYRDGDEVEYENDEDPAPEESREDEDAAVDEKASDNKYEDEAVQLRRNRNFFLRQRGEGRAQPDERVNKGTNDNFSELKPDRRLESREDEVADNGEDQPESISRHEIYDEPNNANSQFMQEADDQREHDVLRKQQRKTSAAQEGNNAMLFENDDTKQGQADRPEKNKRKYDAAEPIGQSHFFNKYFNHQQTGTRKSQNNPLEEVAHDDANRDRRNADDTTDDDNHDKEAKDKKNLEDNENEAEQAIIQKYVKKLNKKEVEELISTLSEDKRKLLQRIIDNNEANQDINLSKREITKKAGAVDENNFMDGVQSDSNKISGPLINLNMGDVTSQNNAATEMTTRNDENKIDKRSTFSNEETVSEKVEPSTVTSTTAELSTSKSDNKREVNINDFNKKEGSQDEFYAGSQKEDLTQLMDDEAQLHYDYSNPQKRELTPETNAEMPEPMRSLEESFSNSNAYEDSGYYEGSNMAPLVRVKRRNDEHAVKKRDAAILPESKVAYVPEIEDEDSDEGNEFYDNGFFDHTANFAKSDSRLDKASDSSRRFLKLNAESNQSLYKRSNGLSNDVASDTMSIGSDNDSVLSGMEGVDENLMYNSGNRKKRAVEKFEPAEDLTPDLFTSPPRASATDSSNMTQVFGRSGNDNDGFEPSAICEEQLSRIKRIRRRDSNSSNIPLQQ